MSISNTQHVTCPLCGAANTLSVFDSINADRRPDLKTAILDGSLHCVDCVGCQAPLRMPPSLMYLDVGSKLVVIAFAAQDRPSWTLGIKKAEDLLARTFSSGPGAALVVGLTARVVFGWSALREKIVIQDAGLDDRDIEIIKLAIIRTGPVLTLSTTLDLRLTEATDDELVFSWVSVETGQPTEHLRVPVDTAASVDPYAPAWGPIRAELSADLFVDHGRFLLSPA